VARYLRQREPSSPVPYLLLRAFRWGELRDAVDGEISHILESPPGEIRAALRRHSQAANWKQVLETAETAMSQGFGRGWLDIQRYAIRACEELGYKNAAKALRSELKALLADLPELPNLIMQDDTGAANPETIAWLRKEGYVSQS
jgi:type VI secretion system protein ImpA